MNPVTIIKPLPKGRGNEEIVFTSPGSLDEIPPLSDFEDTQAFGGEKLAFGSVFSNPSKVPRNRKPVSFDVDRVVAVMGLAMLAFVGLAGWLK